MNAKAPARDDRGFALVELLVVLVIVGVLIAIAIPLYSNYTKSSNDKATQSDVRSTISRLEKCQDDNGKYPTADFQAGDGAAAGTCSQKLNLSAGTTMNYYADTGGKGASYLLVATNSNGSATGGTNGFYCYAQSAGGSVTKKTAPDTPAAYATAC